MFNFIKDLFDDNKKEIKRLSRLVEQINALEPKVKRLSDKQLLAKTAEFKKKLADGVDPRSLIPEAFAVVREASIRTTGLRHYDVQLMAGIAIWEGKIAEQKTGEGKTLTATLPLYLRALEGKGAHLVTVNDYLARRDCGWMGQIFSFLGLSTSCIIPQQSFIYDDEFKGSSEDPRLRRLRPIERGQAYLADITYGTNNEFGFDYLRDNMAQSKSEMVQRGHFFAVVDEVDFALIDEARTPLIISSPSSEATDKYYQFAALASQLQAETDYVIDEKGKTAMLTEYGIRKVERQLGVDNLYEEDFDTIHHIENSLKARTLFEKNKDYVVQDGQVIIVDEFTGRLMHGRRWSDGLHQAIEAKEGVAIQKESKTWATITFQNYFRLYQHLAGMSATAATEQEEFKKIYDLDVVVVPTNKPVIRNDKPDLVYKTRRAKYTAVVAEIEKKHKKGQPVLVGTTSIENNEMVSNYLKKKGIPHQILNAKQHQKEAAIIAKAGEKGAVTVATNMAGRGVDIVLGGSEPKKPKTKKEQKQYKLAYANWKKRHQEVLDLGGLAVIGTERHEARRIDNQLRGRSGRQGDPGESQFFVSLEDDLMRIFGGEQIGSIMTRLKMPENMPISHPMVTKMIGQIQIKIEGFNYDIRKSLVEFDDIVNKQREIIYKKRRDILDESENNPEALEKRIIEKLKREMEQIVNFSLDAKTMMPDYKRVVLAFTEIVPIEDHSLRQALEKEFKGLSAEELVKKLKNNIVNAYKKHQERLGAEVARQIEKSVLLYTIDNLWVDHLTALDSLKEGVRLRGYGQRDPLVEYRMESFKMFKELLAKIDYHVVRRLFRVEVQIRPQTPAGAISESRGQISLSKFQAANQKNAQQLGNSQVKQVVSNQPKVGRNDPCPCGSGKKYKKCCYPKYE